MRLNKPKISDASLSMQKKINDDRFASETLCTVKYCMSDIKNQHVHFLRKPDF